MNPSSHLSQQPLAGKIVVVTGGAGLLGRAFTTTIASAGGCAIVADIDPGRAKTHADELVSGIGAGCADWILLDINDKASVLSAIAEIDRRHGRIDAIVNNAYPRNAHYGRKLEEVELPDFCENVALHVGGYFLVAQQFAQYFRKLGRGNIINIGSIYATVAPRFDIYEGTRMTMPVEYAVIKAGIVQLTRYLAKYLAGTGIRANVLSPGGIADNQPTSFVEAYRGYCTSKGMLDPADICGTLVFLLSDQSLFVNGMNIAVDDGFSL